MNEKMIHIVKKDKKKLIFLFVLAVVAVFLLILGNTITASSGSSEEAVAVNTERTYAVDAAKELEQILGAMNGVGRVVVAISYDGEITETYAYNEERSETVGGDDITEVNEKKELVLTDGDGAPVVTERHYPDIEGVLVVAEGASDDGVRERLLDAVASYLDVGKNRVVITSMEVQ